MTHIYKAKYENNGTKTEREFVDLINAAKWLASHIPGRFYIDDIEYSRKALIKAVTEVN